MRDAIFEIVCMVALAFQAQPPAADGLLTQPTVPLDTRVDAAKVTTLAMPQTPMRLTPPPQVIRRVATQASEVAVDAECFAQARAAIDRGLVYLRGSQNADGAWMRDAQGQGSELAKPSNAASAAVTALVIRAFAQAGYREGGDAAVAAGVKRMLAQTRNKNGFAPDAEGGLQTYVASCCALALAALDSPQRAEALQEMIAWLKAAQWDQSEGVAPEQDWFGGVGYGNKGRPDLSNTQMMLEALHESGAKADDAAVQRALVFVQRCQNKKSPDAAAWARAGDGDGGFVYTVANGGESIASEVAGEGRYGEKLSPATRSLRSYGSMTYAGYKSLLFAGLSQDDPRVLAALEWMRSHYTLVENPGLGAQGLFYYRLAVSRAMLASGMRTITDTAGVAHDWRCELIATLAAQQQANGSWINPQDRWMEGHADLVTAYALLAIEEAIKPTLQSQ